jgi:hypothetical protein
MNLIDYAEHCKLNSKLNIATKVINTTTNKLDDNTVIGKIEIADKNDNTEMRIIDMKIIFLKKVQFNFNFILIKSLNLLIKVKKTPLYLNL